MLFRVMQAVQKKKMAAVQWFMWTHPNATFSNGGPVTNRETNDSLQGLDYGFDAVRLPAVPCSDIDKQQSTDLLCLCAVSRQSNRS